MTMEDSITLSGSEAVLSAVEEVPLSQADNDKTDNITAVRVTAETNFFIISSKKIHKCI